MILSNGTSTCSKPAALFPTVQSPVWDRLRFLSLSARQDLASRLAPLVEHAQPYTVRATGWANEQLAGLQPWQIALLGICSAWVALTVYNWLTELLADVRETGEHEDRQLISG